MKKSIIVLTLCLFQIVIISAQVVSSGKVPVFINNKTKADSKLIIAPVPEKENPLEQPSATVESMVGGGKYYALVIGISNYDDPLINQLDRPVKDAELFYNVILQ